MKNVKRINESQLRAIVAESIKKVLKENYIEEWNDYAKGVPERIQNKVLAITQKEHPELDPKGFQWVDGTLKHDGRKSGRLPLGAVKNERINGLPYENLNSSDEINAYLEKMAQKYPKVQSFINRLNSENHGQPIKWGKFDFSNVQFSNEQDKEYWEEIIYNNFWGAMIGSRMYKLWYSPANNPTCIRIGIAYDHNSTDPQMHFGIPKLDHCISGRYVKIKY